MCPRNNGGTVGSSVAVADPWISSGTQRKGNVTGALVCVTVICKVHSRVVSINVSNKPSYHSKPSLHSITESSQIPQLIFTLEEMLICPLLN
jgi:hypothetical protein